MENIYNNYKKILSKLKEKENYNVVFLVNENSKWKCQSLYDRLAKDKRFNVKTVLTIADYDVYCSSEHRKNKLLENKAFFEKRSVAVEFGWDLENDCAIDIKSFEPDIIFYQVPYNISENQDIDYASNFALCCYVPYYINQSEEFDFMGTLDWHKKLFRFYVYDDYWKKLMSERMGTDYNLSAVSHPILDEISPNTDGDYVIYAAHWSVDREDGLSTFLETGHFMLHYAKIHPEINFVFTHHPTLLFNLVDKGYMTQEEVDEYINEWKKIGYFPPDGDYMDLFAKSKMLISDCGSFRVEYYPTGNPYVYLKSNNERRLKDGNFINGFTKHYHKVHNVRELKLTLDKLLLNNIDEYKEKRFEDREKFFKNRLCSADLILKDIERFLKEEQSENKKKEVFVNSENLQKTKPVFYLKINRWDVNTRYSIRFWLRVINQLKCDYYVLCDKPEVEAAFTRWIKSSDNVKFIKSEKEQAKKLMKNFYDLITPKNWLNPCYAHLTTCIHAKNNGIKNFWNIDADDTSIMIPSDKINTVFPAIEDYAHKNNIDGFSYDMYRSCTKSVHWSYGVTYQINPEKWVKAFENFDVKEWQSLYDLKYCSCSDKINIDLLTTFLNDSKALNLQSYFVNNVYFYHANASLVNGYMGLSLHKDKIIEYPIMKELYKMNHIGISYVPIVDDAIKFDFGISEKDSFEVLKYHWGGLTEEKLNYMDEFYKQKI